MPRTNPTTTSAIEPLWQPEVETPCPVCPRFRPYPHEAGYPVRGHCAPVHRPGLFVIPSIEEYGLYCTDPGFARCPWFQGTLRPSLPHDAGAHIQEDAG